MFPLNVIQQVQINTYCQENMKKYRAKDLLFNILCSLLEEKSFKSSFNHLNGHDLNMKILTCANVGKIIQIDMIVRPEATLYVYTYQKFILAHSLLRETLSTQEKCCKPNIPSKHIKTNFPRVGYNDASTVYRPAGNQTLFLLWSINS